MKSIWNGVVIAESDRTIKMEGNYYFPPEAVKTEYLIPSEMSSTCAWKGKACYFNLEVNGQVNRSAAWHYPSPSRAASEIEGYIAFWKGVKIE